MKQGQEQPINRRVIISFLGKNKGFLKKEFDVNKIALFGSYARNEARPNSDIDIIVDIEDPTLKKFFGVKNFLEKKFKRKVDVVTFKSVRSFIKEQIDKDIIYA